MTTASHLLGDETTAALPRPSRSAHRGVLDLSRNELVHPDLDPVLTAVLHGIPPEVAGRYPAYPELVAELARGLGRSPDEVELFPGSDDAIGVLVDAFSRAGLPMILQEPNYPGYTFHARLREVTVTPWTPDASTLGFRVDDVVERLRRSPPTAVVVTEPHGMLGAPLGELDLLTLSTAVQAGGHLLLIDECYRGFGSEVPPAVAGDHVLRVGSFSKTAGLAGLRLGYVIGSPEPVDHLRRWRRAGAVSALTAWACLRMLRDHADALDRIRAEVAEGRDRLAGHVAARGWRPLPTATNFLTVDLGPRTAASFVAHLDRAGIAVRSHPGPYAGLVQITCAPWPTLAPVVRAVSAFAADRNSPADRNGARR